MAARHPIPRRHAYTLIELLVVIMIAILLMAVTLPAAKTVMENARPREASRILNATFATVKARAASTGHLTGVDIVLSPVGDPAAMVVPQQATQMYMVEVPGIYGGDTLESLAAVDGGMGNSGWYPLVFHDSRPTATPPMPTEGASTTGTVESLVQAVPGTYDISTDLFDIRFDQRGPWYPARMKSAKVYEVNITGTFPASVVGNFMGNQYRYASFQLRRPPNRVGNPIELPKATCIDLSYSGIGPQGNEFGTGRKTLRIMFSPAGGVHSITIGTASGSASSGSPLGTVHLLVGLPQKVNDPLGANSNGSFVKNMFDPETSNLADPNALWVSIGRASGLVTTTENAPPAFSTVTDANDAMQQLQYLNTARTYATAREQKGGL
ncbi:Tfp pilus assembly protein FimT/FimU [Anatilimnocola sp. NA78]|uniref:pilus assembly FimT family protein n=1 Tax=Anatilimnocola sp. NA78 TaxID=3415683 RepID=UPI003CE5A7C7